MKLARSQSLQSLHSRPANASRDLLPGRAIEHPDITGMHPSCGWATGSPVGEALQTVRLICMSPATPSWLKTEVPTTPKGQYHLLEADPCWSRPRADLPAWDRSSSSRPAPGRQYWVMWLYGPVLISPPSRQYDVDRPVASWLATPVCYRHRRGRHILSSLWPSCADGTVKRWLYQPQKRVGDVLLTTVPSAKMLLRESQVFQTTTLEIRGFDPPTWPSKVLSRH